jgi:hypothetical protein
MELINFGWLMEDLGEPCPPPRRRSGLDDSSMA